MAVIEIDVPAETTLAAARTGASDAHAERARGLVFAPDLAAFLRAERADAGPRVGGADAGMGHPRRRADARAGGRPWQVAPTGACRAGGSSWRGCRIALGIGAVAVGAVVWSALGWLNSPGVSVSPVDAEVTETAHQVVIVQPGDTLWSIARAIQPEGDVRGLVDELAARNGGSSLVVGQAIVIE